MVKEIGNFLRNYNFLSLTKSTVDEATKLPSDNWKKKGINFSKVAVAVGAEIPAYIAVSSLRWCGFFNPPLPQPPEFPIPHNNVDFMDVSTQRALWDWKPELKADIQEGISMCLSDKWNVFQVVGEWCIANSFEHPNYAKPTFLTVSEPLENGTSFRDVTLAFSKLKQKDKTAIFDAVYHQTEIKPVSAAGKQVYQDLRAIASKLTQGNEGFKNTFQEFAQKAAAEEPAVEEAPLSARTTLAPQNALRVPTPASLYPTVAPSSRYEPYVPTFNRPAEYANG